MYHYNSETYSQEGSKYDSYINKKLRLTFNGTITLPPVQKAFMYLIFNVKNISRGLIQPLWILMNVKQK